jgi:hypothetical protein
MKLTDVAFRTGAASNIELIEARGVRAMPAPPRRDPV